MCNEAQFRKHLRDEHGGRLLTVHADGKSFRATEEEEGIERCERISDRVDDEGHFLNASYVLSRRKTNSGVYV